MTTTADGHLNQVDLGAVGALVDKIKQRPSAAATTWSAQVRWTGAFRSEAAVRGFAPIASDEPKGLGGSDSAPNPVEQLLGALGNCLAVGYAANASVAGITIRDLRIDLDGDVDLHAFLGLDDGHAGTPDSPPSGWPSTSTPTPMRPLWPNCTGRWLPPLRSGKR